MLKINALVTLAALTGFLTGVLTLGSIWVYYFESPYITYKNEPFPHSNAVIYEPGAPISVVIVKCNSSAAYIFYSSTSTMINEATGAVVVFPRTPLVATPGCQTEVATDMLIPRDTLDGRYHFFGVTTVSGGFASHKIAWKTEPFTVKSNTQWTLTNHSPTY